MSLTGRYIEHVPMVLFWRNRRTLFTRYEGLEQPDGRTMNIASNESNPNTLVSGQDLQITDKSVSFPLHQPDLVISSTRKEVWEVPCGLSPSSDHS